jgi:CAAX protease family protein
VRDPDAVARLAPWVVLIVPISEELMFRFYALRHLANHTGFLSAAVSSSLMFAVVHFNPSGMLAYTTIGLILAWSYRRSGRIAVPILGHVVHNGLALTLSYLFPDIL